MAILENGKHGVQLFPDLLEILLLMFADDVVLVSHTISGLQQQLHILETYADTWGLTVNLDKSNIVVFRRGGPLSKKEIWYYKGKHVATASTYKYLGITFSATFKMGNCVNELALRGKRALMVVLNNLYKIGMVDPIVFF